MADAQTPVLTDEQIDAAVAAWFADLDDGHPHSFKDRMRCAILAAQAPAQPAEAVAWEYRNQHGNPFLSHTDPHKWHPHDQEGFGQFRALVYAAPSQPDRAVMQQALDALEALLSMQSEWHAAFPEHVGDKEAPAMQAASAAIAALSATMEKPNGK